LGFPAQFDAGKTRHQREFYSIQVEHKIGEVHDGAAYNGLDGQEKERGITSTSAATTCTWRGKQIRHHRHPRSLDFTIELSVQ